MRGVLLTGLPGVGKSTACRRVIELCNERGVQAEGFLTEELRRGGSRIGFDMVGLGREQGRRAKFARVDGIVGPQVGKYNVAVQDFESFAVPILQHINALSPSGNVIGVVDEIGKMELFSEQFVSHARKILIDRSVPLLFTIALRGGGFIAEAKRMRGLEVIELTRENRDEMPSRIAALLLASGTGSGSSTIAPPRPRVLLTSAAEVSRTSRWRAVGVVAPESASATADQMLQGRLNSGSPNSSTTRIILWLRDELRLSDNPLFQRAIALCRQRDASLVPVFCFDPQYLAPGVQTWFGSEKLGDLRRRFLEESLADMAASLRDRGSRLFVCDAAPEAAIPMFAEPGDVVIAARKACPEELSTEARVREALRDKRASLELIDPGGITTLFGDDDLSSAGVPVGSKFPEDFKVFYDAVRTRAQHACRDGLIEAPACLPSCGSVPSILPRQRAEAANAASRPMAHRLAGPEFRGGESEGLIRLRSWFEAGHLKSYKATFRHLLGDYSSRLSAHLACGCVSPRRVCAEALVAVQRGSHVEHFIYELCWRDFFHHVARRWGSSLFLSGGPLSLSSTTGGTSGSSGNPQWRRDKEAEDQWKRGATGVPLVDAAMRELATTGYMGNLARQFAAAYLVDDLRIDWRVGADWFESRLLDYDPHSNWGQWARSAGVAPTNEAKRRRVGGTRYFDIALEIPRAEALRYVRGWVPELDALPDREVLAPWLNGQRCPEAYPRAPLCGDALRRYFESAAGPSPGCGGKGGARRGRAEEVRGSGDGGAEAFGTNSGGASRKGKGNGRWQRVSC